MRWINLFLFICLCTAGTSCSSQAEDPMTVARRVLLSTPLIDGHNDLPYAIYESEIAPGYVNAPEHDLRARTTFHTDIERLRTGMVGAQFWSVYIPYSAVQQGAAKRQLEQIDIALQIIDKYPDVFELVLDASSLEQVFSSGKIASLLGIEGGHAIENSLGALRSYYEIGVRYMTLTHNGTLDWADAGSGEHRHGGLTEFGKEVVREMNRLGMLVDLAHTSSGTMHDALDVSEAPVIWSHAAANSVREHTRNVPDDVLRRLPENGGVVMAVFYPPFISSREEATISDVADHIEHISNVAGIDHVGIGSDIDGIELTVDGLEDVSKIPALFAELARRGWTERELAKLAGGNVLRAMKETESIARRLQTERLPSVRPIEDLDH